MGRKSRVMPLTAGGREGFRTCVGVLGFGWVGVYGCFSTAVFSCCFIWLFVAQGGPMIFLPQPPECHHT